MRSSREMWQLLPVGRYPMAPRFPAGKYFRRPEAVQEVGAQTGLVDRQKLVEAFFGVGRQKVNPRRCNRFVIKTAEVVVLRKGPNAAAHAGERGLKRLSREVQPCQPQVIGVAKLGSPEAAGVERVQEFVVTQMGRGKHKRHKPIMAD